MENLQCLKIVQIRTRNNSVFGHFSRSAIFLEQQKHLPVFCLSFHGIISKFKSMKATYVSLGFHRIIWTYFLSFLIQAVKAWHFPKQEYHLNNKIYFQWLQLISSIPENWKIAIKQSSSDAKNLIIHGHHLTKGSRILILEKLTSKELYQILTLSRTNRITSVTYFETILDANNLDWTKIFILSRYTKFSRRKKYPNPVKCRPE